MDLSPKEWQEKVFRSVDRNRLGDLRNLLQRRQGLINSNSQMFTLDFIHGYSPVQKAIHIGSTEALQMLLEAGASPDFTPRKNLTPLLFTIYVNQNKDIVRLLLQHGADILVGSDNSDSLSALEGAIRFHEVDNVSILLEHGALTPYSNAEYINRCFKCAADSKPKILELILETADKYRFNIPSALIFSNTISLYSTNHANIQLMIARGFIPSQWSTRDNIFLHAAKLNLPKTMNMLLTQSPMLSQLHKVELKKCIEDTSTSFPEEYVTWINTSVLYCPTLQSQCKSCIISAVGQRYMEKMNQLQLPNPLLRYLQSLE